MYLRKYSKFHRCISQIYLSVIKTVNVSYKWFNKHNCKVFSLMLTYENILFILTTATCYTKFQLYHDFTCGIWFWPRFDQLLKYCCTSANNSNSTVLYCNVRYVRTSVRLTVGPLNSKPWWTPDLTLELIY